MSATNALALSLMVNALGQPEFHGISMTGGKFQGLPVIVSQHIGNVVALANAADIFLGDDGGVQVDMSREASLEMRRSEEPTSALQSLMRISYADFCLKKKSNEQGT